MYANTHKNKTTRIAQANFAKRSTLTASIHTSMNAHRQCTNTQAHAHVHNKHRNPKGHSSGAGGIAGPAGAAAGVNGGAHAVVHSASSLSTSAHANGGGQVGGCY
jgi:hypothetical protein